MTQLEASWNVAARECNVTRKCVAYFQRNDNEVIAPGATKLHKKNTLEAWLVVFCGAAPQQYANCYNYSDEQSARSRPAADNVNCVFTYCHSTNQRQCALDGQFLRETWVHH